MVTGKSGDLESLSPHEIRQLLIVVMRESKRHQLTYGVPKSTADGANSTESWVANTASVNSFSGEPEEFK